MVVFLFEELINLSFKSKSKVSCRIVCHTQGRNDCQPFMVYSWFYEWSLMPLSNSFEQIKHKLTFLINKIGF